MTSRAMHAPFNGNQNTKQNINSPKTSTERRPSSWGAWEGGEYPFEPFALVADSAFDFSEHSRNKGQYD